MADNFNLRSFLIENKLTKNAQLLKEQEEDYKYFDEEGTGGFYMTTIDGHKIYSMEDSSVMDTCFYAIEDPEGDVEFVAIDVAGEPVSSEDIQNEHELLSYIADFIEADIAKELGEEGIYDEEEEEDSMEEGADDKGKMARTHVVYSASVTLGDEDGRQYVQDIRASVKKGEDAEQRAAQLIKKHFEDKAEKGDPFIDGKFIKINAIGKVLNPERSAIKEPIMKEASYKVSKNSKQAEHLKKGDIITSGDEVVSVSAGAKTPAGKVEVTLKTKNGSTKTSTWGKTTMIGVKPVTESKLTTKERRLVEMVQNAMEEDDDFGYATHDGSFGGDDSEQDVDYKMGRHDDPNQLPNPAPELHIPEGEDNGEMADENVIPEYHSIDELMKEIDNGTNKIAEEHKIKKMKDIAEALRAKVKSLEEGEHAKHIDQKAVKQMGKDIAALEKTAAKLQGVFDKKFNKKEKPAAAPKKEETAEALQEGTFDLRKFLAENRK